MDCLHQHRIPVGVCGMETARSERSGCDSATIWHRGARFVERMISLARDMVEADVEEATMGGSNGRIAGPVALWKEYITNWNRKEYVYPVPIVHSSSPRSRRSGSVGRFSRKIASSGKGGGASHEKIFLPEISFPAEPGAGRRIPSFWLYSRRAAPVSPVRTGAPLPRIHMRAFLPTR